MKQLHRAAMTAAIALSVVSVGDAVVRGVGNDQPPWDPSRAAAWVTAGITVLEVATFALLAAVLATSGKLIDRGSAARRWMRMVFAGELAVLAGVIVFANGHEEDPIGAVAGIAFLLMFLLGAVLGGLLLRLPELRLPAALMVGPLALLPLAIAVDAVAPGWGHPGYAETALYLGIALLGFPGTPARSTAPPADLSSAAAGR